MIYAIDPGTTHSAVVAYCPPREPVRQHEYLANHDLLFWLRAQPRPAGSVLAIEMVESFGMPVGREVFQTVLWAGRFWQLAAELGFAVELIPRRIVKMHLCNSMRAKDANIRQALIDRIGEPGSKKSPGPTFGLSGDKWAALAVAVTVHEQRAAARAGDTNGERSGEAGAAHRRDDRADDPRESAADLGGDGGGGRQRLFHGDGSVRAQQGR